MDSDVPELIKDEDYLPTLTVEQAAWDSLDVWSSHLWGLEAIILKSLEDPDIDSNGKHNWQEWQDGTPGARSATATYEPHRQDGS